MKRTLAGLLAGVFLFTSVFGWASEDSLFSLSTLAPELRLNSAEFKQSLTVTAICEHIEQGSNLDNQFYLNDVLARLDVGKNLNITVLPYEVIIEVSDESLAIRYFDPAIASVITPYSNVSKLDTKEINPEKLIRQIIHRTKALDSISDNICRVAEKYNITVPLNTKIILHTAQKMQSTITYMVFDDVLKQLLKDGDISEKYITIPFPIEDGDKTKYEQLIYAVKSGLEIVSGSKVVAVIAGTPFKEAGLHLLDIKDETVHNSAGILVRQNDGRMWGGFTDGESWVSWFEHTFGFLKDKKVVLLGAGPVGTGIANTKSAQYVKEFVVADKDESIAKKLVKNLKKRNINAICVDADNLTDKKPSKKLHDDIADADIIINTTGLGRIESQIETPLLDTKDIPLIYKQNAIVVDLNLHLKPINFLTQAQQSASTVKTADGVGMMIEQNTMQMSRILGWQDNDVRVNKLRKLIDESAHKRWQAATSALKKQLNSAAQILVMPAPKIPASPVSEYVDMNEKLFKDMLGENKENALLRVPVEVIESVGVDNVKDFLATFQVAPNGYVELYYMSGIGEVSESVYQKYGLDKKALPNGFKRTRENTVTLFPALKGDDISQTDIRSRLGSFGITPEDTILSPIGLQHDPAGLIRATILGLKIMDIARLIKEKGIDLSTKDIISVSILHELRNALDIEDFNSFNLTPDDIIALATGNINNVLTALKKLIKLLPITPIDADDLRKIYEHARKVLLAA